MNEEGNRGKQRGFIKVFMSSRACICFFFFFFFLMGATLASADVAFLSYQTAFALLFLLEVIWFLLASTF
jgi:hypothetical protein